MSGFSDAWCSHCNMRIQSSEGFRLRRLCFWCEQKKNGSSLFWMGGGGVGDRLGAGWSGSFGPGGRGAA